MKTFSGASSRYQACLLLKGSSERLPLSSEDMAFATRMYRETVIWLKRIDHALGCYVRKPLESLDSDVLRSLRVGAVQLLVLRTPAHAAVSATVEAHKSRKSRGLVNAVLRKVANHKEKNLPLHVMYSHPEELTGRWIARYGEVVTEKLLQWNNQPPSLGGYAFGQIPQDTEPGLFLEKYRLIRRQGIISPPDRFYIQDESTALVGQGMAQLPGESVLEVGAAPGGKTAHLSQCSGTVIAMDKKRKRMRRWLENRDRMGWQNCFGLAADCGAVPFKVKFDKVIVDAPCTNTGVYRRRYDARWNWSSKMENELITIQRRILQQSSKSVKSGGILVYSTCSIEPAENSETVRFFEDRNSMFERIPFPAPEKLLNSRGFLSIFPPDMGLDGLFAASWIRKS